MENAPFLRFVSTYDRSGKVFTRLLLFFFKLYLSSLWIGMDLLLNLLELVSVDIFNF